MGVTSSTNSAITYEPIQTITFSGQSSFTFSNIPQTYTDLVFIWGGTSNGFEDTRLRFNGDSGSNYSWTKFNGTSTTAAASRQANSSYAAGGWNASVMLSTIHILNYSNSTTYKTSLTKSDNPDAPYIWMHVNLWRSTAAITSLSIAPNGTSVFSTGSATLYGIKAA